MTPDYIYYPLQSAEEVTLVEHAIFTFRQERDAKEVLPALHSPQVVTNWKHMTAAEKLSWIDQEWTIEALREIKPWVLNNATVSAAFDLCAAKPGAWIAFKEACRQSQLISSQGRGQMQALTKKTRNQMGKTSWPVLAQPTPPGMSGLCYKMSDTIARRWHTVRAEK